MLTSADNELLTRTGAGTAMGEYFRRFWQPVALSRDLTADGAPVRVVIPDMYGYKGVKWVERVTVGVAAKPGYWEQRGYDTDAWVGRSNGL
jgi:DMSO/TMAO reductase YedYZ molybdopterin-dependent catalytic subunit